MSSAQQSVHARLQEVLDRHLRVPWRRPLAAHSLAAYARLREWLAREPGRPLWLDSGCGSGASSRALAQAGDARVLGADQSCARLRRGGLGEGDLLDGGSFALVRMPLEDLWRLLVADGVRPARHLLLYPNPWPKAAQLRLRWHAHPAFPALLALGGEIELRSNWEIYVREFAQALEYVGWRARIDELPTAAPATTPFERKYRDSGHRRWRLLGTPGSLAGHACAS